MIILYEKDEKSFTSLGIGVLVDAINPLVTEEINGTYELEMDYPINGSLRKEITTGRLIVCPPNEYDDPQPFRIYEVTEPINGIITIKAQHISYDTSGYPVKSFLVNKKTGSSTSTINEVIQEINGKCIKSQMPFTIESESGIDLPEDVTEYAVTKPTNMRTILMGGDGSVSSTFKYQDISGKDGTPEYKFDKFKISLKKRRGSDKGFEIRYGKNMSDYEHVINSESAYTAVFPFYSSSSTTNDATTVKEYEKRYLAKKDPDGNVPETFGKYWLSSIEDGEGDEPLSDSNAVQIEPIEAHIRDNSALIGEPMKKDWLSLNKGGGALSPKEYQTYIIMSDPEESELQPSRVGYVYQWKNDSYTTLAEHPERQGVYRYCGLSDAWIEYEDKMDDEGVGHPGWLRFNRTGSWSLFTSKEDEIAKLYPEDNYYVVNRKDFLIFETGVEYDRVVYRVERVEPYIDAYIRRGFHGDPESSDDWLTDIEESEIPLTPVPGSHYRVNTYGDYYGKYYTFIQGETASDHGFAEIEPYRYIDTGKLVPYECEIQEGEIAFSSKWLKVVGLQEYVRPIEGKFFKVITKNSSYLNAIFRWSDLQNKYVPITDVDKEYVFYPWQYQSVPEEPKIEREVTQSSMQTEYVDLKSCIDAYVSTKDVEKFGSQWLSPKPDYWPFDPPVSGEYYKVVNDYPSAKEAWINPDADYEYAVNWLTEEDGTIIDPEAEISQNNVKYFHINGEESTSSHYDEVVTYKDDYVPVTERYKGHVYQWKADTSYPDAIYATINDDPDIEEYGNQWLKDAASGEIITPVKDAKYKIQNGTENFTIYTWNNTMYTQVYGEDRYVDVTEEFEAFDQLIFLTDDNDDSRTLTLDLTSYFETKPLIGDIRAKALEYITKNNLVEPTSSITVSFVKLRNTSEYENVSELEKVELGDTVNVVYAPLSTSIKMRVKKVIYNVLSNSYDEIELGDEQENISGTVVTSNDGISVLRNDTGYTDKSSVSDIIAKTLTADYIAAISAKFSQAQIGQLKSEVIKAALIEATQGSFEKMLAKTLTAGDVVVDGVIYAQAGTIGGFDIKKNAIVTKDKGLGDDDTVYVGPGSEESANIAQSGYINGWAFAAGKNFGVDKRGRVFANDYYLKGGKLGNITASEVGMTVTQKSSAEREVANGYSIDPSGKAKFNNIAFGEFYHKTDGAPELRVNDELRVYNIYDLTARDTTKMHGDGVLAYVKKYPLANPSREPELIKAMPLEELMNTMACHISTPLNTAFPYLRMQHIIISERAVGWDDMTYTFDFRDLHISNVFTIFISVESSSPNYENAFTWEKVGTNNSTIRIYRNVDAQFDNIHVFAIGAPDVDFPDINIVKSETVGDQTSTITDSEFDDEHKIYTVYSTVEHFAFPLYVVDNYDTYKIFGSLDQENVESVKFIPHRLIGTDLDYEYFEYTPEEIQEYFEGSEFTITSDVSYNFDMKLKKITKAYIQGYDYSNAFTKYWLGEYYDSTVSKGGKLIEPVYGEVYAVFTKGEYYHKIFKWTNAEKYMQIPGVEVDNDGNIYFNKVKTPDDTLDKEINPDAVPFSEDWLEDTDPYWEPDKIYRITTLGEYYYRFYRFNVNTEQYVEYDYFDVMIKLKNIPIEYTL